MLKNVFSENSPHWDMYRAICCGNVEKLHDIIDSFKPSYLIPWKESKELLLVAIFCGRLEIAKILLRRACDVGDTLSPTMTLYPHALRFADVEFVQLLLEKDPQSLHARLQGDTLLHLAVRFEIEAMVELLIDRGANVNLQDKYGLFPLIFAARSGNFVILKLLLNAGADTESKSEGETSLLIATKNYNVNFVGSKRYKVVVKELLDAGANVNHKNSLGQTPLHMACLLKSRDIIPLLLSAGADINAKDNEGLVPCDAFMKLRLSCCQFMHRNVPFPLIQHLIILKEADLYLHEKNKLIIDVIIKFYFEDIEVDDNVIYLSSPMIKNVIEMCQSEIDLMKEVKTDNGFVLYDILKKHNKISLHSATESEIQLLRLVILQNKFPLYSVIFKTHLKYAELRRSLLDQAQHCFASLIELSRLQISSLPEEIRIHIISYLKTSELNLFIEAVAVVRGI